jgi:hypothetical protein
MNAFYHVVGAIYIILGIGVVLFCTRILFLLILEALEYIPAGWIDVFQNYFYSIVGELNEHLRETEQARHRKIDFSHWVREVREINEGRRMPVRFNA